MTLIKRIFILGTLFISLSSVVVTQEISMQSLPSLDWQKQNLKSNIRSTIDSTLSAIIKSNEYIINIDIATSTPDTPDFNTSENDGGAGQDGNLDKKDIQLDAENNDPKADESSQSILKFTNETADESNGDYIIFSKLGIEAPLLDNFNDFRPDGKIILAMDSKNINKEKEKEEEEKKKKLENEKNKPSNFEQAWIYNRSIDVFNNLRSVTITILLNEELQAMSRESVKRAIDSLTFSLGSVTPNVTIEYVPMTELKNPDSLLTKILNLFEKFAIAIGLVISALVLGATAFVLLKQYQKMAKETAATQTNMTGMLNSEQKSEKDEAEKEASGGGGAGSGEAEEVAGLNGIERFQAYIKKSKMDACMLIKKWIKAGDDVEKNALRALVQQLDNTDLVDIFSVLTEDEKAAWKALLSKALNKEDIAKANLFISNQIVEDIILPSAIIDTEACDLLLKVRPEQAAKMISEHTDLGAILLNVMNSKFVNQVLDNLSQESLDKIIEKSITFNKETIASSLENLKKQLRLYMGEVVQIPFLQKVRELLPMAKAARELSLYRALAMSGDINSLRDIAQKRFPAHLIKNLPEDVLAKCIAGYPVAKRVEFFLSSNEQDREFYVNLTCPPGSKAHDLISFEFEAAANNLSLQRKLKEHKEEIFNEFVEHARHFLKDLKSKEGEIQAVVEAWVEQVGSEFNEKLKGQDSVKVAV